MIILKSIIAGATAAFRAIFASAADKTAATTVGLYGSPETERYIALYRENKSTPYFGEADSESEDGLILH